MDLKKSMLLPMHRCKNVPTEKFSPKYKKKMRQKSSLNRVNRHRLKKSRHLPSLEKIASIAIV